MTMLVVTHEMGFAREVGDRIVLMSEGRVIETAEPETFFGDPETDRAKQFLTRVQ
jgi:polar amino acid transport system ATP-binding protein